MGSKCAHFCRYVCLYLGLFSVHIRKHTQVHLIPPVQIQQHSVPQLPSYHVCISLFTCNEVWLTKHKYIYWFDLSHNIPKIVPESHHQYCYQLQKYCDVQNSKLCFLFFEYTPLRIGTRFVWALWASLVGMGLDSKCNFTPPTILLGFPICPRRWGISSKSLWRCATAHPVALFWGLKNHCRGWLQPWN